MINWLNKIPKDWEVEEFRNVAELRHGYQFRNYDFTEEGIKIFKITQIKGDGISDISSCSYIDANRIDEFERVLLKRGDILIALTGATIGKVARFNYDELVLQNYRVGNFFPLDQTILLKEYFYQFLKSDFFFNQILANQTQSAQQNIGKEDINNMSVILPSIEEQTAIASILSTIDAKIENNLAINKTLEEMAMALYKEWFVDFGPFQDGRFVESELGMIPEGWEVKQLQAFANLIMGQSPKSIYYNKEKVGLPFHQGVTNYGIRFPQDETFSTEGKRLAAQGDILFSVRAPVGRINICKNNIVLGRGIASIRFEKFNHFMFYALKNMFLREDIIGSGTVFNSVNKNDIQSLEFIIPPEEILLDFEEKAKKLDEKYYNNYKQNQSLTTLRDTLLPKLIRGEVRLNEFANR